MDFIDGFIPFIRSTCLLYSLDWQPFRKFIPVLNLAARWMYQYEKVQSVMRKNRVEERQYLPATKKRTKKREHRYNDADFE